MIASLKGILSYKAADSIIIDVAGVGYDVHVSQVTLKNLPEVGEDIEFLIHTHVAEGVFALYGFPDLVEKQLFKKLMTVNGVGPKLALAILSGFPANELIESIVIGNVSKLTGISGVGKKTAERLVLDLKDKLTDLNVSPITQAMNKSGPRQGHVMEETLSALVNLGYNKNQAERALSDITIEPGATLEKVLKASLAVLSRN